MDSYFYAQPASQQPYALFGVPAKDDQAFATHAILNNQDPLATLNDNSLYQHYYDHTNSFAQTPLDAAATLPSPSARPSIGEHSSSGDIPLLDSHGAFLNDLADRDGFDQNIRGSSDDDKDNMTPAQTRRKAQNRAAQRAFRERKERHVKDLEIKLKSIEAQSTGLLTDNERLRRELDRLATQNEILRATSAPRRIAPIRHMSQSSREIEPQDQEDLHPGPKIHSPKSFNAALSHSYKRSSGETISHRVFVSEETGERLLAPGAAWELIQHHPLFTRGRVDLGEVVERLREKAVCDASGPAFLESDVNAVVEDSIGVPGDELI